MAAEVLQFGSASLIVSTWQFLVADERVYVAASQEGGYPRSLIVGPEGDTGGLGESLGLSQGNADDPPGGVQEVAAEVAHYVTLPEPEELLQDKVYPVWNVVEAAGSALTTASGTGK